MHAPTTQPHEKPEVRERKRHLEIVASEQPPRRSGLTVAIALAAVFALLVAGGVYAWQHNQLVDRTAQLTAARHAVASAQARAADLQQGLLAMHEHMKARLGTAAAQTSRLRSQIGGLTTRVRELHGQMIRARSAMHAAQMRSAHLRQVVGPPLAGGVYVGRIQAVGVTQSPPRLVASLPRNAPQWRLLQIDPGATVTLFHRATKTVTRHMSLVHFQRAFAGNLALHTGYRITLLHGAVTAITQIPPKR